MHLRSLIMVTDEWAPFRGADIGLTERIAEVDAGLRSLLADGTIDAIRGKYR